MSAGADQLKTINADSVTNIAVEEVDGAQIIPELLYDNGDLIIFTQKIE